jgi:translation elongation factor EF-Tu-like GTPase
MIKIKAIIKLYKSELGRKTSFVNNYRPLFNFIEGMKTSGQITLIDRKEFYPGDEGLVEITFLNKSYLGDNFSKGTKFIFDEGREPLGEGEVKEILN